MTPVVDLRKGQIVRYLGVPRLITSIAHHDADGLSLLRFDDGHHPAWLHCAPDRRLLVVS